MNAQPHPAATDHVPWFVPGPDGSDGLMTGTGIFLIVAVIAFGILFFRLHTLPEQIAHKSHKIQFEIVAVLGLISLFTHMHIFWIAGLLIALIDFPDFGWHFNRIAGSVEKIADVQAAGRRGSVPDEGTGAFETKVPDQPGASRRDEEKATRGAKRELASASTGGHHDA